MRKQKIRDLLTDLENSNLNYSRGYPLGPLAEEYATKILPKSRVGPNFFRLPQKPPTHMEYYEEDALAEILKEMIEIDKDVELRKNALALMCDFSMHDLFAVFDNDSQGFFDFREFQEVFDLYKIYPSIDYLRLAFINIDRDLDSKVTLKEFLVAFTPKDKNYKDLVLNRGSYNKDTNFSRLAPFTPDTNIAVTGFLKAMVDAETNLERVRDNTKLRRNFNYA